MKIINYFLIVTIILIVLIAIALVLMNLSPTISIVFLGNQSLDLPLGLWLFIAFLSGIIIGVFWQLINFLEQQQLQRRIKQLQAKINRDQYTVNPSTFDHDDWGKEEDLAADLPPEPSIYEDELIDEDEEEYIEEEYIEDKPPVNDRPKEKVYDADYRVIKPPTKEPELDDSYYPEDDQKEDWGFDFDNQEEFWRKPRR